jgi:hypothetical protein
MSPRLKKSTSLSGAAVSALLELERARSQSAFSNVSPSM